MGEKTELFTPEHASQFFKKNLLIIILVLGGVLLIFYGFFQYLNESHSKADEIQFIDGSDTAQKETIFVDVSGAVKKPGLYEFTADARIADALEKAGGVTEFADREYIAQNLNKAQMLSDGMKLYIPQDGEEYSDSDVLGSESSSGLVSLNSATQSELEELPQVGPVTAEKIINGRPYSSVDDLLIRKVVGVKAFETIKDLVSVN